MGQIHAPAGANTKKTILGRGTSSKGRTCGKGFNGQNARSGGGVRPGFEGGQMPLYRRVARRGFSNYPFKKEYVVVSLDMINEAYNDGETVDLQSLKDFCIIKGDVDAKILSNGEITKKVIVDGVKVSAAAAEKIKAAGGEIILGLDDILTTPVNGSGCNERYGLLGTNKATEETVKLFPDKCQPIVERIQKELFDATGKKIEVMVYGDGAFKDPVGKIWELADPVVSPAYTSGLEGQPNELKLKYLADNDFANLTGDALKAAIEQRIREKDADLAANKDKNLVGNMVSQGTTPRRLTDLIGSLCDLTSGSGDKGTPIILIQGYFDNLSKDY